MQNGKLPATAETNRPTFAAFALDARLARAVADLNFTTPTKVQADTIPLGLAGRDVLAAAATGSGKTAAFLLPLMHRLLHDGRRGTRALVLVPTRELAAQVVEHFEDLAKHTRLRGAAVYGGVGMAPQETAFRKGVDVIVATPGRLMDHMERGYAGMPELDVLVLDEADRMLDMGFLPAIRRILADLPKRPRQTLFFSATMPPEIVALSRHLLKDAVAVNVERQAKAAVNITQALYPVPSSLKPDLLIALIECGEVANALVFCRTKHRANRLAQKLERAGIQAARIHGNRSQSQRTAALRGFKSGECRILVATDIVARGIDINALEHVVNFDIPASPDDYVHRVGRTGRADATGDAFTFVAPEDEPDIARIERVMGRRIDRRLLRGFNYRAVAPEKLEIALADRIAAARAARTGRRPALATQRARAAAAGAGPAR